MSQSLLEIIKDHIRRDGPMPLRDYMGLCLGHPQHGYYMTRDPLGAAGDFTTSPEISQLFGEMIGAWLADIWIKMGSPPEFTLLECGPGRGALMVDILRATKNVPGFHKASKVVLMEMSPVLKAVQKQNLSAYDPYWITDTTQLESKTPVFLVANEFLDALPIDQLVRVKGAWRERRVAIGPSGALVFVEIEADKNLIKSLPQRIHQTKNDGIFETSLVLNQYIKSIDDLLEKEGGVALFIDYGHPRSAFGDTLQAMKSHTFADVFETPGTCDITAHVDFENIAKIAKEDGLSVHGPVSQNTFLKKLGIETRVDRLCAGASEDQKEKILSGFMRISDTNGMGSLFKVLALCNDPKIIPEGFDEGL